MSATISAPPSYRRILVPTDFSSVSLHALNHARLLAETFRASLHVLHVVEDPVGEFQLEDTYALPADFLQRVRERAEARLAAIFPTSDRPANGVELALREGSPFVEIVRYARDQAIDLIVMGTHGRGPIAHMLMGSVAEQVARKAPCPVLVVRDPSQPFRLP